MLHITPEMARSAYEYLRTCPPFRRWHLPDPNKIEWIVTGRRDAMAWCRIDKPYQIRISQPRITNTQSLIESMAHEMIHLRQALIGQRTDTINHGKKFKKLADSVCRKHGFNRDYF